MLTSDEIKTEVLTSCDGIVELNENSNTASTSLENVANESSTKEDTDSSETDYPHEVCH